MYMCNIVYLLLIYLYPKYMGFSDFLMEWVAELFTGSGGGGGTGGGAGGGTKPGQVIFGWDELLGFKHFLWFLLGISMEDS